MTTFNTGNSVPSTDGRDLSDNAESIDSVTNSNNPTTITRTGKTIKTLAGLESEYLFTAINGGVWAAGQTFTAFNQYMVFGAVAYKPKFATSLPHTVGASPDPTKVEPIEIFNDIAVLADKPALIASSPEIGQKITTQGFDAEGDGGSLEYIILSTLGGESTDPLRNLAIAGGKFARADKPFYIAKDPTALFAPGETKYLFMNPEEYTAANSGAEPLDQGNQFHYFATGDDIRVEFEAGTGDMQFFLEGGVGKEVWYGLQESGDHVWSIGMNTAVDRSIRFVTGFGIAAKDPVLEVKESGEIEVRGLKVRGQTNIEKTGAGVAPLITINSTPNGSGIISKAGDGSGSFLLDCRLADETVKFRVKQDGAIEHGIVSQTTTGYTTLSNGMLLQWGTTTSGVNVQKSIVFPVAFPTSCDQFVCASGATLDDNNITPHERVDLRTAAGTTVFIDGFGSPTSVSFAQWFAIGH